MGDSRKQNDSNMASGQDDTTPRSSTMSAISSSVAGQTSARGPDPSGVHRRPDQARVASYQNPQPGNFNVTPHSPNAPWAMGQLSSALPDYNNPQGGVQQYSRGVPHQPSGRVPVAGASTPAVVYQISQNMQFPPSGYHQAPVYGHYPQPQYGQAYPQAVSPTAYAPYPSQQPRAGPNTQQSQYGQQVPIGYYYYTDAYGRPTGSPTTYSPSGPQMTSLPGPGQASSPESQVGNVHGLQYSQIGPHDVDNGSRQPEQQASSAIPRGPPRKPKQSGHALWVGNLPPGATIGDLKDHFSRDARNDIESVFLISKSNCAFVNYRSEEACARAMARFHDSRFQGVRLVCRLRKTASAASGLPTAPAAMVDGRRPKSPNAKEEPPAPEKPTDGSQQPDELDAQTDINKIPAEKLPERFFIVKSLTHQDLEQSVRNGIWATQSHNETALNKAFESADNVYLFFSANKSGEYFGYARMTSPILENAAEVLGPIDRIDTAEPVDTPKTIPTPATDFAPRGRIIDDSARGTIFWEAELTDDENQEEDVSETGESEIAQPQTFGKPFKIEWMSTTRVPFYRTRGFRNPWNANREVKIARDGTELEPNVGRRLMQLFHRSPMPSQSSSGPNPPSFAGPTYPN